MKQLNVFFKRGTHPQFSEISEFPPAGVKYTVSRLDDDARIAGGTSGKNVFIAKIQETIPIPRMVYIQNANTPELRDLFLGGYVQDVGVLVRDLKGLSDILRVNVQEVNSTLPFFAPISSFSLDNGVIKYNSERLFHWNLPPLKLNNKQRLPRKKIEQKSSHRQLYVLPAEDSLQITEYDRSQRGRYSTLCLNGENVLRIFYDGTNFISKTSFNSSPLGYNPIVVPNNFKLEEKLSQV